LRGKGIKVGGIVSSEILERGVRVGFKIIDLESGAEGILAHVNQRDGPQVSKYRVCLKDLENVGVGAILSACKNADLIVVDEVGPMELYSKAFEEAVLKALESGKVVLGTIHYRARTSFTNMVRNRGDVELIEVTYGNRNSLPKIVAEAILGRIMGKSGG
jgi:nucleoside-triphosphatase